MSTKLRTILVLAALAFGFAGVGPAATQSAAPRGQVSAGASINSFLGQTVVLRDDGTRAPIEALVVGDLVLATDPATGELSRQKVLDVFVGHGERHMYALTIAGAPESQRLFVTAGHAFHLVDRGHTPIEQIQRGDVLLGQGGLKVPVRFVEDLGVRPNVTVYNLRVSGPHTFTVVSDGTRIVTYSA